MSKQNTWQQALKQYKAQYDPPCYIPRKGTEHMRKVLEIKELLDSGKTIATTKKLSINDMLVEFNKTMDEYKKMYNMKELEKIFTKELSPGQKIEKLDQINNKLNNLQKKLFDFVNINKESIMSKPELARGYILFQQQYSRFVKRIQSNINKL